MVTPVPDMKELIAAEMKAYVSEDKGNFCEELQSPYYEEPIIQFAEANDPLFEDYKRVVGPDHATPQEAFERTFGTGSFGGGTVVSVVLPISETIRKANRAQKARASREWALLRTFGDEYFVRSARHHLAGYLTGLGYRAVAPLDTDWYNIHGATGGPVSNWSERHIAYAAGLGTFSINDGFITEKGIAIRLLSVVTDLQVPPDVRVSSNLSHTGNCLLCSKGICGVCITRCPVQAISKEGGHDKIACMKFVYGEESRKWAVLNGGEAESGAGCGLCQTKVPCESRNPMRTAR
ncbi:(Fe-S)-binding protein [Paenibacillus sp. P2(2022)]|uniref:(Fe-S)-binding protein n=1 Tax=Paenibacillus TaxID=44249 RepID=UPI000697D075|nr:MULTISPECIES: (Fe-S)-binding protein [Paenibacillus]MDG0056126.1 (Fe-S)-binding protein [Paenibacillus sp. P2(2022)]UNL95200.1 (Fe-S)-binding protein [Paenibacillus polymyxa]WOZ40782.1 (Fe-S)-binding protein [Paenibacillus polymyxa]SEK04349.1 Epoxyqueuosine reductase QueG (queuosine biosynthesis) [Paenibacillus polymyxa]